MFILSTFRNDIYIKPADSGKSRKDTIRNEINRMYANKVILEVGLCICLFDILEVSESYVSSGDGGTRTDVLFRLIMFRPVEGEILEGTLKSSNEEGLFVHIGSFFSDVFIPAAKLQEGTQFDHTKGLFVWNYEDNELDMAHNEKIRFRVLKNVFRDVSPTHSEAVKLLKASSTMGSLDSKEDAKPYTIIGEICDNGLGLLGWWI